MSNAFHRPTRRRKPAINLTSLIDVMFLLVIFLTVSTTFRDQLGIDVTLPHAESAQMTPMQEQGAIVITAEGDCFFGGQAVDEEALRGALAEWANRDGAPPIVMRADEGASFGKVVRVMDITREVGGIELIIPTQPIGGQLQRP